ncbi:MAG TPA: glycosyltransferase family 39 protein [Solirubrobacterales bacterium]|nr:glycosyltransferase family 39 protein [Solirubrobacterales bacterium]
MSSGLAARNGGRAGLAALAAILLLGLGLRIDYAWQGRPPVFDAVAYARIAANLEQGNGFTAGHRATQPSSNYSPGLPLIAAGIYELSGGLHERLARVVLALIGALSVAFSYLIGRRLCGPAAGLIGALAVAIYPALLEYQGMLMTEPLAAALLSGAVLAMLWAEAPGRSGARARSPRWLVPGLVLGALTLVRPEYLAVSLLLALVAAAGKWRNWRSGAMRAGILLLGVAIVVTPWTLRNAAALGRFVPISTGGGQVLFSGTYLPSGGDPQRVGQALLENQPGLVRHLAAEYLPPAAEGKPLAAQREIVLARVRLEQILAAFAAQRHPGVESDKALSQMGREQLWSDVSERPLEYIGFLAAKVGDMWSHGPREVMRRPVWEALHWALVFFGLIGLILLSRRGRWEALLLGTIFLSITAISALLVASPRRVLVMIPLVAALAGIGAVWACSQVRLTPLRRRPSPG